MIRMISQEQILDQSFRKKIIDEILSPENISRKNKYFKRRDLYKDNIIKYVLEQLAKEKLKPETIALMANRTSNISLLKKIINKLARSYNAGVIRSTAGEDSTAQVESYANLLNMDQKKRKADRYRELHKNCLLQIVPDQDMDDGLYELCYRALEPWQYDVIEEYKEREEASVVILSDFVNSNFAQVYAENNDQAGRHSRTLGFNQQDGVDDIIADNPIDSKQNEMQTFIFWSEKYHFTTDAKGYVIPSLSPEDGLNPIQKLPFLTVADNQDGQYWAQGGDDLIDGTVLVNLLMTDMNAIMYMQGYGQVVISGKNLPDNVTMGPHHALMFDYDEAKGEPKPEVTVVSATPPIDSWMKSIEQYVALLLSTNNLSPSSVAIKLDAVSFPSGIAMLIESSEAKNDIKDVQNNFAKIEKKEWQIISAFHNLYFDQLKPEYKEIGMLPEDLIVSIKFGEIQAVVSEKEKLENIKIRQDIGLNTKAELIMIDDPSLNLEEAQKKELKIKEESANKIASAMIDAIKNTPMDGMNGESQI